MRPQDIIAKKRDGEVLTREEIARFIRGVSEETWADYQISALVMAMFIQGLNSQEQADLTQEMLHSGEILDFSALPKPKADKHSTGGVGDKTSLIIAPLAAACGLYVPMISGRGLGHTGGTLDKLESISGYRVNLSTAEFYRIIESCGFAMSGQTAEIVPADKKLYALRDATATVPYIPLIVGSIMSKKLAEGLDALILDVKTGNGAFMEEFEMSKKLAQAMCQTGNSAGVKTAAIISEMSQPLGEFVGNSLEVYECLRILRGETTELMLPTLELAVELTVQMLVLSEVESSTEEARRKINQALSSGAGLEKFRQNVKLQGGNEKICDSPEMLLTESVLKVPLRAKGNGFVFSIDTKQVGNSICEIGGGRIKITDEIDYAVGFQGRVKIGDAIEAGEILGVLYCRNEEQATEAGEKIANAYLISEERPAETRLIREIIF